MCKQESKLNRRHQGGVIVILLGLAIVMLIGFAGLAIDLGRFFAIKTEIQNAVDACALSAASQLRPGQNNNQALIKAVAYGRVFSTGGTGSFTDIQNRGNFQSAVIDITDITFSRTLTFPDAGVTFDTAKYVRCAYPLAGIPVLFMKVQDSSQLTATVSASAVATLGPSSSVCGIPVGLCKKAGGTSANNYGYAVGEWDTVLSDGNTTMSPGWRGWITYPNGVNGAKGIKDLLSFNGQCNLTTGGGNVVAPGDKSAAEAPWNSRFGLYENPVTSDKSAPDFSGFAYSNLTGGNWPAGFNAWSGTHPSDPTSFPNFQTARSQHKIFNTPTMPPGFDASKYTLLNSAQHIALGKNRRIAVAPVLDCSTGNVTIIDFACILMLNPIALPPKNPGDNAVVEFLGLSTAIGSVCSSGGGPGTAGAPVPVLAQ